MVVGIHLNHGVSQPPSLAFEIWERLRTHEAEDLGCVKPVPCTKLEFPEALYHNGRILIYSHS